MITAAVPLAVVRRWEREVRRERGDVGGVPPLGRAWRVLLWLSGQAAGGVHAIAGLGRWRDGRGSRVPDAEHCSCCRRLGERRRVEREGGGDPGGGGGGGETEAVGRQRHLPERGRIASEFLAAEHLNI